MAPRNVSKQQAEQTDTGEGSGSEQETLDPKAISRDMEKNVGTTWIGAACTSLLCLRH